MEMFRYVLKIETKMQIFLMLTVLASVILSIVNINFQRDIINHAILQHNQVLLLKYGLLYLVFLLTSQILGYWTGVLFMKVTQQILMKLRTELYNHILRLNIGFFYKTPVGEIMSRLISEIQQLAVFLSTIILIPLNSITSILGGIILITAINWKVGIVSFSIFAIVFIFLPKLRARLKDLTKEWSQKMRNISSQTEDSITHYMEIQSNNTFAYEEYKFRKSLEEFGATGVDIARVYGKTTFASQFFSGLATLSALMVGGWIFIKNGGAAQNIGDLTAMITAIGTIINPLNSLIDFSQRYQESAIKFNMIRDYLNIPKEMEDKKNAKETEKTDNEIKMDNLSFGFDPQKKILKNINLDIKPGEHVALVGPAGCGKSTLSLLVNRMMKASLGELKLNDLNIVDVKLSSLRKTIGYVAQAKTNAPILYGGTLIDNIVYPLKRKDKNSSGEEKEWLDIESIGIKNLEELQNEILEIIKDVALYEDVYNFGLCNMTLLEALTYKDSIFKIKDPEAIRTEILKGRKKLKGKMTGEYKDLIEFFDEEKFMNYSNIMENIIFTSAEPFLKDGKSYEILKKVLLPVCKEGEIYETIFEIGCKTALELGDICKKVKSDDSQLIRKLGIPQQAMRQFVMISEKIKSEGKEKINKVLPPPAIDQIYRLGFEYSLSHGMDIPVDDALKSRILKARKLFKERLTPELKDKITFYEKDNYIDGATIRDNLIMGKINTVVNGAEERISSLLKEVITEVSLEDEIITLGLLMDIGERGAKLSGGQAQKTAITRVLLKKPSILILDEATSALDNASQQKINDMLLKRFKDKTVITIAHRLDTIKDYDRIVVLKAGEIIETGSFDELLEKKGLFFELWETLFAQRR